MIIVESIFEIPVCKPPLGLTFGNFDGVHLGHQHLIHALRQLVTSEGTLAVLTFSNHPAEVLYPHSAPAPLCTIQEKIKRLEALGVNLLILLPFTQEIAALSYDQFIIKIKTCYPFTQLVLGKGATFGKNRGGTEEQVKQLGDNLNFKVNYIDKMTVQGESISSRRIRTLLAENRQAEARELLGQHSHK